VLHPLFDLQANTRGSWRTGGLWGRSLAQRKMAGRHGRSLSWLPVRRRGLQTPWGCSPVPSETLRGIGEPIASRALLQTTHRSMAAGWNHPSTWSGLPSLPYAVRRPSSSSLISLLRVALGNRELNICACGWGAPVMSSAAVCPAPPSGLAQGRRERRGR
jgi:hypothetical protein